MSLVLSVLIAQTPEEGRGVTLEMRRHTPLRPLLPAQPFLLQSPFVGPHGPLTGHCSVVCRILSMCISGIAPKESSAAIALACARHTAASEKRTVMKRMMVIGARYCKTDSEKYGKLF
jgi:hypothetical protein